MRKPAPRSREVAAKIKGHVLYPGGIGHTGGPEEGETKTA